MFDSSKVLAVVLAGGEGSRLFPLTEQRAKPAVPFGGKYRIIDFTLSNCINSGLRRVMVLTQYKSHSLERHIRYSWGFLSGLLGEYCYPIPPQQRINKNWYLGTADAIHQNLYSIQLANPTYVIVLAGDHVYKMDYRNMLNFHIRSGADLTIGTLEVDKEQSPHFGVVEVNSTQGIVGFLEKPKDPAILEALPPKVLVSMGIYVFNLHSLVKWVELDAANQYSDHDFGKNVIPQMLNSGQRINAYQFRQPGSDATPYWRDVGTLDAYYEANMDLISVLPSLNLYDPEWPFRTYQEQVAPAKFLFSEYDTGRVGMALDSIVCDGCIISGGRVIHSVLSSNVRINSFSDVRDSVLMNGVQVERNCRIQRAVVDKNVVIKENSVIGYNLEEDARRFTVSDGGIVFIPKGTVVEAG